MPASQGRSGFQVFLPAEAGIHSCEKKSTSVVGYVCDECRLQWGNLLRGLSTRPVVVLVRRVVRWVSWASGAHIHCIGNTRCIAHHTHSTTQLGRKVCCVGVFLAWLLPGEPFVFVIFICFHRRSIYVCKASVFYGGLLLSFCLYYHPAGAGSLLKLFDHTVAEATVFPHFICTDVGSIATTA